MWNELLFEQQSKFIENLDDRIHCIRSDTMQIGNFHFGISCQVFKRSGTSRLNGSPGWTG